MLSLWNLKGKRKQKQQAASQPAIHFPIQNPVHSPQDKFQYIINQSHNSILFIIKTLFPPPQLFGGVINHFPTLQILIVTKLLDMFERPELPSDIQNCQLFSYSLLKGFTWFPRFFFPVFHWCLSNLSCSNPFGIQNSGKNWFPSPRSVIDSFSFQLLIIPLYWLVNRDPYNGLL